MKKKHQVFVSSTYTDMLEERQAVVEAILRAGHIPAGMELFAAGDQSQLKVIQNWIDESDIFMLILGGRYGSIDKDTGKSYIQLEYEYALAKKKPRFPAVISDAYADAKANKDRKVFAEQNRPDLLKAFRESVTGNNICRFFNNPTDLKVIVFESLGDLTSRPDLPGWVRSNEVLDPKTTASTFEEITRLREENNNLTQQIAELRSGATALDFDGVSFEEIARSLAAQKVSILNEGFTQGIFKDLESKGIKPDRVSTLRLSLYLRMGLARGVTIYDGALHKVIDQLMVYGLVESRVEHTLTLSCTSSFKTIEYTTNVSGRKFFNLVQPRIDEFDPLPPKDTNPQSAPDAGSSSPTTATG